MLLFYEILEYLPRYKGEFQVTRDYFQQFPDGATLPELKVLVK